MKLVKLAMVLGMLASLVYCGKCEKTEETPQKGSETPSSVDGGEDSSPSDAGASIDLDGGKTSSLDGSVHIFDAAVVSIDASIEEIQEEAESGPSDLNHG